MGMLRREKVTVVRKKFIKVPKDRGREVTVTTTVPVVTRGTTV